VDRHKTQQNKGRSFIHEAAPFKAFSGLVRETKAPARFLADVVQKAPFPDNSTVSQSCTSLKRALFQQSQVYAPGDPLMGSLSPYGPVLKSLFVFSICKCL
jgi:hypothetical protein